ncbi:MAG TPA: cupin domain-containing protein [Capillimicrobium sp.]|nr:cupin domain-containing protein [Capillimicrobium sp.]
MCPDTGEEQGPSGPIGDRTAEAALGARIRAFRQLRQLSVRGLANEAGASAGFLSELERGQVNASVSMLRRIAGALGLTVADLFDERDGAGPRVLRRDDRPALATPPLARKYLVSRKPLHSIEAYAGEFEPGGSTGDEPYTHGDAWELFLVIAGQVRLELDGVEHTLGAGDSIEYPTSMPHRASNLGDTVAEVLWVISPPTTH